MKKWNILLITVLLLNGGLVLTCQAQKATTNEAKLVALTYLGIDTSQQRYRVAKVNTEYDSIGNPLMYEVIMNDSTIVLVSGNKTTCPILATYQCADGEGILEDDALPCGLAIMMDFYKQTLTSFFESGARLTPNEEWQRLLNGEVINSQKAAVSPLLTTQWGQGWSNDSTEEYAYNKFTPSGIGCQHCLAGCVAVSMGQVMKYYQCPIVTYKRKYFFEQFDWCHMPNSLISSSPLFDHECEAISKLLFTCADAVSMRYGCGGSQSYNSLAIDLLMDGFGYSSEARFLTRKHSYLWLLNSFLDTIKMSLNMGQPVIMGAYDRDGDGHSFVCDGYNDNLYHFNWGWNGKYNGFYSFNPWGNINVWNFTFSHDFDAIVFLCPEADSPDDICNFEMHLEDFYTSCYNTYEYLEFYPYDNTPKTMNVLYSADISSPEEWRTIPSYAQNVEYRAYTEVNLQDGFTAERGCDFIVQIDHCSNCETRSGDVTPDEDADQTNSNAEMYFDAMAPTTVASVSVLYPNPTSGEVTVIVDGEVQSIVIYNA